MPEENVVGLLSEEEVAKIAKEQLNEDPKRTKEDIKAIQEWMKKQPHLSCIAYAGGAEKYRMDYPEKYRTCYPEKCRKRKL
jgi:hypothetical protein